MLRCNKLLVPVLATLELLTISIEPNSALLLPVIKGGLKSPSFVPTSNDGCGKSSVFILDFLYITELYSPSNIGNNDELTSLYPSEPDNINETVPLLSAEPLSFNLIANWSSF